MATSHPAKWKLTKKIIGDICPQNNGITTMDEIKAEFEQRHPDKESSDVSDDVRMMTVNSQSRLSHLRIYGKVKLDGKMRHQHLKNSNREYPRTSSPKNERDILFDLGNKQYEIYTPSKHGIWEIVLDADDVNRLHIKDEAIKTVTIYPDELDKTESLFEGIPKTVLVNSYERNPIARTKCIDHYGVQCVVCGFDFEKTYGDIGKGFIHVHHLTQLSDIGQGYEVDPVNDLRPVCPNCHAMLHKRNPPYTIDELKLNK